MAERAEHPLSPSPMVGYALGVRSGRVVHPHPRDVLEEALGRFARIARIARIDYR